MGASWREKHGYGDDVIVTLSWTSLNEPVGGGDWAACARALVVHGMPAAERESANSESVMIAGRKARFSGGATEVLLDTSYAQQSEPIRSVPL